MLGSGVCLIVKNICYLKCVQKKEIDVSKSLKLALY